MVGGETTPSQCGGRVRMVKTTEMELTWWWFLPFWFVFCVKIKGVGPIVCSGVVESNHYRSE